MAKYKAYPEYKDSGVEWLGEIPNDWQILCGKYVFKEIKELSTSGDEMLLSVSEYYGVKPRQEVIEDGDFISRADSLIGYKKCQVNDLAMNIMLAWKCGLGVSKYEGIISPAYSVFRFDTAIALPGYMHYLLRTKIYTDHFKSLSTGVIDSRLRLYPEMFGGVEILLPELDEQVNIYAFLDHETAKIDNLIEKQQQLIELLKEKRQAVISHAVTKGLNPDVSMKDSGVEWLGEVPEHWSIKSYRYACLIYRGKFGHRPRNDPSLYDGKYPFIQTGDIARAAKFIETYSQSLNEKGKSVSQLFPNGTLVMAIAANIGDTAILGFEAYAPDSVVGFKPYSGLHLEFLRYSFMAALPALEQTSTQSTQANLNIDRIGAVKGAFPPLKEQLDIINHIDDKLYNYDLIEDRANLAIQLLQERRTALISAAVTGKIDVRDWVAPASSEMADIEESQEVNA
ncbi:restriction endonuclease subunit S [Pectobacterium versatile]|uniref:restriction endonuclease subunit S n=1 Tax=Pectobacterium versatile TaxID=2488639 RepID=UPI001CCAD416|nr:restriction endonuclease subunit S [Pectobacterium versatile]